MIQQVTRQMTLVCGKIDNHQKMKRITMIVTVFCDQMVMMGTMVYHQMIMMSMLILD